MRLVLFDIDGTILLTRGSGRRAFTRAMREVVGLDQIADDWPMAGKTDVQIYRELMAHWGCAEDVASRLQQEVFDRYVRYLELALREDPICALPGVRGLVAALQARTDVLVALLTGNVRSGAQVKLAAVELWSCFPFGAFGCDSADRLQLPAVAMARGQAHVGRLFDGADVVVLGDTPRDVACGQHVGARTVAVATGPYDCAALAQTGADAVLEDLSDTAGAVSALLAA